MSDLEEIRQRRMMELMAQGGGGEGGMPSAEQMQEQEERMRAQEEKRHSMLVALMTTDARERLNRIALVKPEKARAVEAMILQAAQRGQITEKVSDERLMSMLEQINGAQGGGAPKVTIQRRRPNMEDDEDW